VVKKRYGCFGENLYSSPVKKTEMVRARSTYVGKQRCVQDIGGEI
jgi:hypothetical protein